MPRNQQNDTERHREVNQWIFITPGKKCRFDTHLDDTFFQWSKKHAVEKSELILDCEQSCSLLENLWAIAIYMWVLIYRTRSQIG